MADLGTYPLRRPVKKPSGEPTSLLVLREPTGRDIRACGFPFSIDVGREGAAATESMRFNHGAIMRYIQTLGDITSTDADTLHAADVWAMTTDIVGFFGDAEEAAPTSSTGTSTSP